MIRFNCPICHEQLEAQDNQSGFSVKCFQCNELIKIPEIETSVKTINPKISKRWIVGIIILACIALTVFITFKIQPDRATARKEEIQQRIKETAARQEKIRKRRLVDMVVSKPIFGICLGENIESLNRRIGDKVFRSDIQLDDYDKDVPSVLYIIDNSNSSIAKNKYVFTYEDRIHALEVVLKDTGQTYFDAIRKELTNKYGPSGDMFVLNTEIWNIIIDGVPISIEAKFSFAKGISLLYIHAPLANKMYVYIGAVKRSKIKDDI